MQEETRRTAGVLIGIHRRQRLKEDPAGGWTQVSLSSMKRGKRFVRG